MTLALLRARSVLSPRACTRADVARGRGATRSWSWRSGLACALACATACSGGGDGTTSGSGDGTGGGDDGTSDTAAVVYEPVSPSDACELAPVVEPGRYHGELFVNSETLAGVCGMGGPDAFLRVTIPYRLDLRVTAAAEGFTPRVEVLGDACARGVSLGCGLVGDEGVTVRDLLPGSSVHVVVGGAADDPAILAPGDDRLPYYVDVAFQRVLDVGARCKPDKLGRCVTGTVCAPVDMTGDDSTWRCTETTADACVDAEEIDLEGTLTTLSFPGPPAQSDAHQHSCAGAGLVERVFRLRAVAPVGPDESLVVRTSAPGVGLALRTPGCLPEHERACAAPSDAGASFTLESLATEVEFGARPYLFVEWAADEPALDGFVVELERTSE